MEERGAPYGWILGCAFALAMFVRWGTHTHAIFRMGALSIVVVAVGVGEAARRRESELRAPAGVVVAGITALFAFLVLFASWLGGLYWHWLTEYLLLEAGPTVAIAILAMLVLLARRRGWYLRFASGPAVSARAGGIADTACVVAAAAGWLYLAALAAVLAGWRGPLDDRLFESSIVPMFASAFCLFIGVLRGGRLRRPAAFANAVCLLVMALLWDLAVTPRG